MIIRLNVYYQLKYYDIYTFFSCEGQFIYCECFFFFLDLDKVFEWEPLRTDSVISKSAELRCRPPSGNPYPKVSKFLYNYPPLYK